MERDDTRACSVSFAQREIILETGGTFSLHFAGDIHVADAFLTIDIYDLDDAHHPTGHVGWWRFPLEAIGERVSGHLGLAEQDIAVSLAGTASDGCWINDKPPRTGRYVVSAVLRSKSTNLISALDRIPAFARAEQRVQFRRQFSRNWQVPRLAKPHRPLPQQTTVRIVSKSMRLHDAVGNLCLGLYRMLRQNDVAVKAYAEYFGLELNDVVHPVERLAGDAKKDDYIVYFYSIYDDYLNNILNLNVSAKIAYFHGVTTPNLLRVFDPQLSEQCTKALEQIRQLGRFDILAANSSATARDLADSLDAAVWTVEKIKVITPCLISDSKPVDQSRRLEGSSRARLLYVGRLSPHKRIEHLLALFAEYRRSCPDAECLIAGAEPNAAYRAFLSWTEQSRLAIPSGRVHWLGEVPEEQLQTLYQTASVYVSMSEHEGFCLPILEAMNADLPVFSYAQAAVREVLDGSGIVFYDKDFIKLAKDLRVLLDAPDRLARIVALQRARAHALLRSADGASFWDLLDQALSGS
ncbi:MAG: glycosyltransferase family 4 protein [Xanthobacteraceae bacterium]